MNVARSSKPGSYSRALKLRSKRPAEVKSDINVRFFRPADYAIIKRAAARAGESMNLFITAAALRRARRTK